MNERCSTTRAKYIIARTSSGDAAMAVAARGLRRRQAARHEDLARAHQLDDLVGAQQARGRRRASRLAPTMRSDQRVDAVVDDLGAVQLGDLQDLGPLGRACTGSSPARPRSRTPPGRCGRWRARRRSASSTCLMICSSVSGSPLQVIVMREKLAVGDVGADDQALDVVAAAREHQRDAHEHAGLVAHQDRDGVQRAPSVDRAPPWMPLLRLLPT